MNKLVTTSIPYINDDPHIGHLYEFIIADIFVRYLKKLKNNVFFLSGTDENGIKIARSAKEKNINIKKFVNEKYLKFYSLKSKFDLSFNKFIRTSSKEHKNAVYKFWNLCQKDIYIGEYRGYYCYSCEAYYDEKETTNLICPIHKKNLERIEEKNYFFRLTKYIDKVKELIEKGKIKIYPKEKKIEILNILRSEKLKDLSISRDIKRAYNWGIPVPYDNSQVIYVWFDALINYISGLGFGSKDEKKFKKFWLEGEVYHFIGKDIVKFHAIYWPAMLLSANIKVPENIIVHYFININKEKMSKTIGNVIYPDDLLKKYKKEIIRSYLFSQPIFADWDFDWNNLENFYIGVLKNELGNLIMRIFGILNKAEDKFKLEINELEKEINQTIKDYQYHMNNFEFNISFLKIMNLVKLLNNYIDKNKIWENLEKNKISTLVLGLKNILNLINPLFPNLSKEINKYFIVKNKYFINQKIKLRPIF